MANFDPLAMNPGLNFITGKITSPFLKQHKSEDVKEVADNLYDIVKGGLRIVNDLTPKGPQIDGDLMPSDIADKLEDFASGMAENLVNTLTEETKRIASKFTSKIIKDISSIPADVLSMAAKRAVSDVQDMIKEAIESQTISAEDRLKQLEMEAQQARFDNIINEINKRTSQVMGLMNDMKGIANVRISLLLKYVEMGPQWIEEQTSKQMANASSAFEGALDEHYAKYKQMIDEWKENMANTIAEKISGEIKKKVFDAQKDTFDKLRKAALVIKSKAHQVLQVAKLQIMALLGINLPI